MTDNNQNQESNNTSKAVKIETSFSNVPPEAGRQSIYARLMKYAKYKGMKETDIIRLAVSALLDRVGF